MLSLFTTEQILSWSDCYYSNPEYDKLYDEQATAVDPAEPDGHAQAQGDHRPDAEDPLPATRRTCVLWYNVNLQAFRTDKWTGYDIVPPKIGGARSGTSCARPTSTSSRRRRRPRSSGGGSLGVDCGSSRVAVAAVGASAWSSWLLRRRAAGRRVRVTPSSRRCGACMTSPRALAGGGHRGDAPGLAAPAGAGRRARRVARAREAAARGRLHAGAAGTACSMPAARGRGGPGRLPAALHAGRARPASARCPSTASRAPTYVHNMGGARDVVDPRTGTGHGAPPCATRSALARHAPPGEPAHADLARAARRRARPARAAVLVPRRSPTRPTSPSAARASRSRSRRATCSEMALALTGADGARRRAIRSTSPSRR